MKKPLLDTQALLAREPDIKRLQDAYALVSTSPPQAIRELETLAGEGSVQSMVYLSWAYRKLPDRAMSEKWAKAAYENDSATGLYRLGLTYWEKGDRAGATAIFQDGAFRDDFVSKYWVAKILLAGPDGDAKMNEIRRLLEESSSQGHSLAKNTLAFLFMKGRYGIHNVPKGIGLYFASLVDAVRFGGRNPTDPRFW